MPSRFVLSTKLMNTCVVRESLPDVANVIMPRVLDAVTGSSLILFSRHSAATAGLPGMPHWTMKPETTRKKRADFQISASMISLKRTAPSGAHFG